MSLIVPGKSSNNTEENETQTSTPSLMDRYKNTPEYKDFQSNVETIKKNNTEETISQDPFEDQNIPENTDRMIRNHDFNESPAEIGSTLRTEFSPSETVAATKNPLETIMLHSDVDKDTALRTMSIAAANPNMPIGILEGDKEVLDYAEKEFSKSKELQAYNELNEQDPAFIASLTDPNVARVILNDTANGELVWKRLRELQLDRNGSLYDYAAQTAKVAGSEWAKLNIGIGRTATRLAQDFVEYNLENSGTPLSDERMQSEISELERSYDTRINELEMNIKKTRDIDPSIAAEYADQQLELEEERDKAVQTLLDRSKPQPINPDNPAIGIAKELKEATRKIDEYMQLTPWLNNNLPQTDSTIGNFAMQAVVAGPQIAQQIASYALGYGWVGLTLTGAQVFSSSVNNMDKEGVNLDIAVPTAALRTVPEVAGDYLTLKFIGQGIKAARKVLSTSSVVKDAAINFAGQVFKTGLKEFATEGSQNLVGTAIELTGIGISGVKTPEELAERMFNEGIVGSIQEGLIAAIYVMPSVVALSKVHGARIKESYKQTKILNDTIKTAEKVKDIKDPVVREKIIEANTPKVKIPEAKVIEPRPEPRKSTAESVKHDRIENDEGVYIHYPEFKEEKVSNEADQKRLAELLNFDTAYFQGKRQDSSIENKIDEQLKKDFHEEAKSQYEKTNSEIEEQQNQKVASEIISEQMKEIKIQAGALKTILDENVTDPTERKEFLDSLQITEEEILRQADKDGYVSTDINKVLTHAKSTLWEAITPYTKQFNQDMSLAEAEQYVQAFNAVSDHLKDLEYSELEITHTERKEAAAKMLRNVYTKKSEQRFIQPAAEITARLFESINRGTDNSIMENLLQGFAIRRGEAGQIHFLHKNDLADIRERRYKLSEQNEKASKDIPPTQQNQELIEDSQLKALEKDEAYFRGITSVGENTSQALQVISTNQDIFETSGPAIIEAMKIDGVITDKEIEQGLFLDKDGVLTKAGREFVSNTLLSKLVNNSAVLDNLSINAKNRISAIAPYLLAVEGISPSQSILPEFWEALLYTSKLKKKKTADLKTIGSKLDTWLNSRSKAHLEQAAKAYLRTIRAGKDMSSNELANEIIKFNEADSEPVSEESPQLKALKLDPIKIEDVKDQNTKSMIDDEAQRFVLTPDNQKNWGMITEDQANAINAQVGSNIQPDTPIRLQVGHHKLTGGFGLIHLIEGHKKAGTDLKLLQEITSNFDEIRASRNRLILVKKGINEKHESAFVELLIDKYYSVITQYSIKTKRLNKMPLLWSRSSYPQLDSQPESPALRTNAPSSVINKAETTPRSAGQQSNDTEKSLLRSKSPHLTYTPPSESTGFDENIANSMDGSKSPGGEPQNNINPSIGNIPLKEELVNKNAEDLEAEALLESEQDEQTLTKEEIIEDNILNFSRTFGMIDDTGEYSLAMGRVWEYVEEADKNFNPSKSSYESWIKQAVYNGVRDEAKELRRGSKEMYSLNYEDAFFEPTAPKVSDEEIDSKVADAISEYLGTNDNYSVHKQVFDLTRQSMKREDVAKKLNLSQGRVSQIIKETGKIKGVQEAERLARGNSREYFQRTNSSDYRGKITFNDDTFASLITLAQDGNITTYLHELSHFWLHTVEQLVNNHKANEELVEMFNKSKKALKANESKPLSRKNHEEFASSFEAYITSGEAPTGALIKVFNSLKKFATSIYKYFKETYGQDSISTEIKDVFDNILATEQELTRYKKEKKLTRESDSYTSEIKNELFGDKSIQEEKKARQKAINEEERLFKKVAQFYAKNGGYDNARKAAEQTVAKDPFYGAIKEITTLGGINIDKFRPYLDDKSINYINKRHSSKDKPFITEEETDISLLEMADRAGYENDDLPVETFINDLIGNPTLKEASNVLFEENKEIVREQLRKQLQDRDLLTTEDTTSDVEDMLFDVVAYRKAFDDIEGKKLEYEEARARAREQKNIIENEIDAELNSQETWKAVNYKYHQREANRLGKEVDSLVRKLKSLTGKDFKTIKRRGKQRAEVTDVINQIERMQKARARATLAAKKALEISDTLRSLERELGSRKLISALKNVREDFKKSIVNMVYTYKLPASLHPKGGVNLNLAQQNGFSKESLNEQLNSGTIIYPKDVELPVSERNDFTVLPEDIMPDWIKHKDNIGKSTFRDMKWGDLEELYGLIEAYLELGSEKLDQLKYQDIANVEEALAYFRHNTRKLKDKEPTKSGDNVRKSKALNIASASVNSKKKSLKKFSNDVAAFFQMEEFDMLRMDGFERGFYYNLFTQMREAGVRFDKRMVGLAEKAQKHYAVLRDEVAEMEMRHGNTQLKINGVSPTQAFKDTYHQENYTAENILAMCLYMGNDATLYSLVEGHELGKERWENWIKTIDEKQLNLMPQAEIVRTRLEAAKPELDAIKAELNSKGWEAVQGLLDLNDSLFNEYNNTAYKVYRKSLVQEKAMPIIIERTADGEQVTIRGGYVPLSVDHRLTQFQTNEKSSSKPSDMQKEHQKPYSHTGINKSATIARMRDSRDGAPVVKRPLKLTLDVLPEHYQNVTKFITHGKIVQEADRIFHNNEFKTAFIQKFGEKRLTNLHNWLNFQVNPRLFDGDNAPLNKGLRMANSMLSIGALGYNVNSAAKQGLSTPNGINAMNDESVQNGGSRFAGYKYYALGQKLYLQGVKDNILNKEMRGNAANNFVFTASEFMSGRNDGAYNLHLSDMNKYKILNQDLSFEHKASGKKVTLSRDTAVNLSFAMLHMVDKATVTPLWLGAFHQSLAQQGIEFRSDVNEYLSEEFKVNNPGAFEKAVKFADYIISSTQPVTLSTDRAPIQQHQFWKMFTVFGSYTFRLYNRMGYNLDKFVKNKNSIKEWEVANMAQFFIESFATPALAIILGRYALFENDDKDEERDLLKFVKDVGWETSNQLIGTIPFVRDAKDLGNAYRGGMLKVPALKYVDNKVGKAYRNAKKGDWGDAGLSTISLVGDYYGTPFNNIKKSITQGWELVTEGEISTKKKKKKGNK